MPSLGSYVASFAGALVMFYLGRALFMRKKNILVDVI